MTFLNSATYRFIPLVPSDLAQLKSALYNKAVSLGLKGTILLSPEGINFSLSGILSDMKRFKKEINTFESFKSLSYNDSYSAFQPFHHLFVKIKKQIIPYLDENIPLNQKAAPYIEPSTLHDWLQNKRDITLIDTRNQYEVNAGSFKNAFSLHLEQFKDFPTKAETLPPGFSDKVIVTFCTGGIRCEKASATLLQQGFKNVYQLKGGILNYLKTCGDQHYEGGCFVFDQRQSISLECFDPN